MIKRRFNTRALAALGAIAAALAVVVPFAHAGGPLLVVDGQPVRWSRTQVVNPFNSNLKTVDSAGRVLYRVDSGKLGPLSNAEAAKLVDRIFKLYTDIPTADIDFVKAGPIIDPATNAPVDVNGSNFGRFANPNSPTYQNPIIFDSDGSITGEGGVLGFFGFLQFDQTSNSLEEGMVVLNGGALAKGSIGTTSFLGVFTHEFGHFAGPLDHSQINGNIAADGLGATMPAGFTAAQAYDLYAPFTETMYPFIFDADGGSALRSQFGDSGYFIASLDMDTQNALSNLYPTADYGATTGAIQGRVVIKTAGGDIPVTGVNVIARRVSQGGYVPPLGTLAFLALPVATDNDGVPEQPPTQASTDSLATVSSAVTGLEFGQGTYRIQGLPSGSYMVQFQQISPDFTGGSGVGPLPAQLTLPFAEQFFNGPNSSSNSASVFTPVTVNAGSITTGIDIILNGFSNATPAVTNETEPNQKKKKPQRLSSLPIDIRGAAATGDASVLKIDFGDGDSDKIEDLYRFTVTTEGFYAFALEATSGSGDLDIWIFSNDVNKKKTSLSDPNLIDFSATASSNEFVIVRLTPGTYLIAVSMFDLLFSPGNQNYRLRAIPSS